MARGYIVCGVRVIEDEAVAVAYLAGLATAAAALRLHGDVDAADVVEDMAVQAGLTPNRPAPPPGRDGGYT